MKIKLIATSSLVLGLLSCADGGTTRSTRGSKSLQAVLARGAGAVRSDSIRVGQEQNLAGSSNGLALVKVDDVSGVWSYASFDTRTSEAIPADKDLIQVSRDLVARYAADLGFSASEILDSEKSLSKPYPNTVMVRFGRQVNGIPVAGAYINLFFAVQPDGSYRLNEIKNQSFGPIPDLKNNDKEPSARDLADVAGLPLNVLGRKTVIKPKLGIDGRYEFAIASEFLAESADDGEKFTLTVDHSSKNLLEGYSHQASDVTTLNAESYQRSYVLKDNIIRPLVNATVVADNQKLSTDDKGQVNASGNLSIQLGGAKSIANIIDNAVSSRNLAGFNVNLGTAKTATIKLTDVDPASLNAYFAVQSVAGFVSKYVTAQEFGVLQQGIGVNVNLPKTCNAYYDGATLNFFKQGDGCANTALISDVIYHEFGHAVDDWLGPHSLSNGSDTGITDSSYSEGIGDSLAMLMTHSPDLGPGFELNSMTPTRSGNNTKKHPPKNAADAEVHTAGMIFSGAMWETTRALVGLLGESKGFEKATEMFIAHLKTSDAYLDAYEAMLRADDDDNNSATQAPHYCLITRAFANHNITGGVTVKDDCVDADTSLKVRVDNDDDAGKLTVLASAYGANKIMACPGKVTSCQSNAMGYAEFTSVTADDVKFAMGDRKYYSAKASLDVKANPIYTLLSVDAAGNTVGLKTLNFAPHSAAQSSTTSQQNSSGASSVNK